MLENRFLYPLLISRINISGSYGYKEGCKKQIPSLFPSPCFYFLAFILGPNLHTFSQPPFEQKSYQLWQRVRCPCDCQNRKR